MSVSLQFKTCFLRLGLREQGKGQDWDAGDLISWRIHEPCQNEVSPDLDSQLF